MVTISSWGGRGGRTKERGGGGRVIEGGIVYRWARCGGDEGGLGRWRGAVGQDVCLPMSRDSERKRRGELESRVTRDEGREISRVSQHLRGVRVGVWGDRGGARYPHTFVLNVDILCNDAQHCC